MSSLLDSVAARLLQTRWFVRAPIWLYRCGLGRLVGTRIVMLEHTGRKSGLPRYVCLEVVERPGPDTIVIVSGFGPRSQWYQNLEALPECKVSIGRRRAVPATTRMMSDDEARAVLDRYQSAHPNAWKRLSGAIEKADGHPVDGLPMIELTLE